MEMDAVNAFNGEMLSMIDMTPPISRAKMMSVTKAGIKAIKLYKHVVQIVEKFIKRCKPDLKVAGLYVVDSIIRQSRHQFGVDKDVFAPRFLKNFNATFENLYQCPADDKGKILRVLNLWQKNEVFGMDIIQPLLDIATAPVLPVLENGTTVSVPPAVLMAVPHPAPLPVPKPVPAVATVTAQPTIQNPVAFAAVAQLLQGTQGVELQQLLQNLHQSSGAGLSQPSAPPTEQKTSLAKTLLDRFDYDDEPEPVEEKPEPPPAAPITINLPPELQQALQAHLLSQLANQTQMQGQLASHGIPAAVQEFSATVQEQISDNTPRTHTDSSTHPSKHSPQGSAAEIDISGQDGRDRRHRRSRSRSPQRQSSSRSQRSRSGSHSQRSRHHRSRSRSRERQRLSPHSRSEERRARENEREKERERERERRQKGLPSIKKETLSVCSTTLWIGQLDKRTQKQDIMCLMEEFGQIESINMIPPRGCAYIVMVHRQDANTALSKLSRGAAKVNQKAIKIAWALNKGIKTEFKKFWDVERGVTYIPWDKVKPDEIQSLREGGILDAETLKSEWNIVVANPIVPITGGPEGRQGNGAALPAVPQSPVLHPVAAENVLPVPSNMGLPPPAMRTSLPLSTFPPPGFNLPQMPAGFPHVAPMAPMKHSGPRPNIPSENPLEEPSKHSPEGPKSHTDPTGGQPLNSPPPARFLGPRPGFLPPQNPLGPRPPFMPTFPNDMPRPNMPPPNMPRQMIPPHVMQPQMLPHRSPNPMFREPRAGRFRMPMMRHPVENFPPPREGVPPQGPPRVPIEEEQWEEKPYWNDWQEHEPERRPERFGNGPPFQGGGWGRGRAGHRGRGNFGN
ncbi:SR-related and CTD-associated factor 4-like [Xyrauchen texanus]|uniref:SR-related and CTD-associated factor 4-like n=1 Tax=Xyrauchen texanus TaxID=154827 RepID=UPI002242AD8C|nr:SR-related and CTD-associated factor 4-like [Xyrauchen texanus]